MLIHKKSITPRSPAFDIPAFLATRAADIPPVPDDDSRKFELIAPGNGAVAIDTMIYKPHVKGLRPLVILNSVEFSMPPSVKFCEKMQRKGLQVVFMRRNGFGRSPALPKVLLTKQNVDNGAAAVTEATILATVISALNLKDVVLLSNGTAQPVACRLCCLQKDIALTIFSNPLFNIDSWQIFQPDWFKAFLRQSIVSKSAAYLATKGLRYQLKKDPISFFDNVLILGEADLRYRQENPSDFARAALHLRNLEPDTGYYDLAMSLKEDRTLVDGYFERVNAMVLGAEPQSPEWKNAFDREAARLNIRVVWGGKGSLFAAYANSEALLDMVERADRI